MLRFLRAPASVKAPQFRTLATHAAPRPAASQTLIEKIVQRYAVDLAPSQTVRAGDYVSIRPNVVMTHDNTGPCISK